MKRRILVTGFIASRNFGDALLCDVVRQWISEQFPSDEVLVRDLFGREEMESTATGVSVRHAERAHRKEQLRQFLSRCTPFDAEYRCQRNFFQTMEPALHRVCGMQYDAVVFAGGQILMDWLTFPVSFLIRQADDRGIPVFLNSAGNGPRVSPRLRKMMHQALESPAVRYFSVRDGRDSVPAYYGLPRNSVSVAADPGLWADTLYCINRADRSGTVGLGVMLPNDADGKKIRDFFLQVADALDQAGRPWQIFTNGEANDVRLAQEIAAFAGHQERLLMPPASPEELCRTIASFDGIISMRLHSIITAASFSVPAVGIVWDRKVQEFMESVGAEDFCCRLDTDAAHVAETFFEAEQTGWNRARILSMREDARRTLIGAMRDAGL